MATSKKKTAKPMAITVSACSFDASTPATNEHDAAAVIAMADAIKEIAIAMQKIADTTKGRATSMNAPMLSFGSSE